MWLSDRRTMLAALAALPLAACGFTPAYAPGGVGQALRGQIRAADPQTSHDFDFVAAFEDRLGRPAAPRYRLDYRISTFERGSANVPGMSDTRISLFGTVDYTLIDIESETTRTQGGLRNVTHYSSTDTQLATRRAKEDAEARLMRILADQVAARLMTALAE